MLFKKIEATLTVEGMHCQKCVARITEALKGIEGVKKVNIDLNSKKVNIICKNEIAKETLTAVIEKLGFKVI